MWKYSLVLPCWSSNKCLQHLCTSQWLRRVPFDLWLTAETRQACSGVFSGLNYRAWVNVKLVSAVSRRIQCEEGGCVDGGEEIQHAAEVGTWRSKVAPRRPTGEKQLHEVKRELSGCRKPLSEPFKWKQEIGIDSPVTEATFDMILNDLAFCLLCWTQGLIQSKTGKERMNWWAVSLQGYENLNSDFFPSSFIQYNKPE